MAYPATFSSEQGLNLTASLACGHVFCQNDLWNWFHRISEDSDDDGHVSYDSYDSESEDVDENADGLSHDGSEINSTEDASHNASSARTRGLSNDADSAGSATVPAIPGDLSLGSPSQSALVVRSRDRLMPEQRAARRRLGRAAVISEASDGHAGNTGAVTLQTSSARILNRQNSSGSSSQPAPATTGGLTDLRNALARRRESQTLDAEDLPIARRRVAQRRSERAGDIRDVSDDYDTDDPLTELGEEGEIAVLNSLSAQSQRHRRRATEHGREQRNRIRRSTAIEQSTGSPELLAHLPRQPSRNASRPINYAALDNLLRGAATPEAGPSSATNTVFPATITTPRIAAREHPKVSNLVCPQCRTVVSRPPFRVFLVTEISNLLNVFTNGRREISVDRGNQRDGLNDATWGGLFPTAGR